MYWQTTRFQIALDRARIMGIVNVTPDSFFDGAQHASSTEALRHCEQLLQDGADMLDIGGESTRPGATPLSLQDELQRILPVVKEAVKFGCPISVDTYKPQVMQAVLDLGADIINDVWALRWGASEATNILAAHPSCGVCLMHMHLEPQSMQLQPMQGDVPAQVSLFLQQAVRALCAAGVDQSRIVLDPGIGFGKTIAQNFSLLARQSELLALNFPLLLGWSRKSSLSIAAVNASQGERLGPSERLAPSLAAVVCAVLQGAAIVRVHDVKETAQALKVLQAIKLSSSNPDALNKAQFL